MTAYGLGLNFLRWIFKISILADPITSCSRIWLRHVRWRNHLRTFQFDAVIDGGANIGEFSQIVRDVLPRANLLCVEPHPACAAQMRRRGYRVIEAAILNRTGRLPLFQDGPPTSSTVLPSKLSQPIAEVEAVRLCDLPIEGKRLLIKLDLQGAELSALAGLGELEARCAGFLVEVSLPPDGNYEELTAFFRERDFVEFASVNELFSGSRQIEADILWIKRAICRDIACAK